jgi:hypothetical protein
MAVNNLLSLTRKNHCIMKKKTSKKLELGKIKIASMTARPDASKPPITTVESWVYCTDNISQGAPICSVDSCRF